MNDARRKQVREARSWKCCLNAVKDLSHFSLKIMTIKPVEEGGRKRPFEQRQTPFKTPKPEGKGVIHDAEKSFAEILKQEIEKGQK